jgi:hypothetical protein
LGGGEASDIAELRSSSQRDVAVLGDNDDFVIQEDSGRFINSDDSADINDYAGPLCGIRRLTTSTKLAQIDGISN